MSAPGAFPSSPAIPVLRVHTADGRAFRFSRPFHIGRAHDCDVRVDDVHVSRMHVSVSFSDDQWSFRDLQSSNGVFVNGQRVAMGTIDGAVVLALGGLDGPILRLEVDASPAPAVTRLTRYAERYFGARPHAEPVGKRTMMIRKAYERVRHRQQRRYRWIVAALAVVCVAAAAYAYHAHRQLQEQRAMAQDLFYRMKSLDLAIANVERMVASPVQGQQQIRQFVNQRREMAERYDSYASTFTLYDRALTEPDRLILRVTRTFGECELAASREYVAEVRNYIGRWQSSGRFERDVALARQKGYTKKIVAELVAQDLPAQFFYLAMQESDFDAYASGPPTSMGIAKGMWQFIPGTGARYGLTIGPLAAVRAPDPRDDRHQWNKATEAAARYIKDIYSTDAQASGLLVMASYNWGENRVLTLLRSMPADPRERNFWKLLEKHRASVPQETYEYVFYIVAAAAIGENPRVFGFPFDNPLLVHETIGPQ